MSIEKRNILIINEYRIPRSAEIFASKYTTITWEEALKLYQLSVDEAKVYLAVEHICDAPYGKGFALVKDMFIKKLSILDGYHKSAAAAKEIDYSYEYSYNTDL